VRGVHLISIARLTSHVHVDMQVVEAFNTQFRLRLIAALKKEFKRLTGGTEGVTSISTAKLGEEEGMTKAIAEGADDGGRAARKSEKVCGTLHRMPLGLMTILVAWRRATLHKCARPYPQITTTNHLDPNHTSGILTASLGSSKCICT